MSNNKKVHKVIVDRGTCIGSATCVVLSSLAFDLDEEGIAIVKETVKDETDEKLFIAAQSCPVQAISLMDENGNQISPKK